MNIAKVVVFAFAALPLLLSAPAQAQDADCGIGEYENSYGDCVEEPDENCGADTTAVCVDGSCSHSEHRQGTCSNHGGVEEWINPPPY